MTRPYVGGGPSPSKAVISVFSSESVKAMSRVSIGPTDGLRRDCKLQRPQFCRERQQVSREGARAKRSREADFWARGRVITGLLAPCSPSAPGRPRRARCDGRARAGDLCEPREKFGHCKFCQPGSNSQPIAPDLQANACRHTCTCRQLLGSPHNVYFFAFRAAFWKNVCEVKGNKLSRRIYV